MSGRREAQRGRRFYYLTSDAEWPQSDSGQGAEMWITDTIINGMKPQTIGRALGIGIRVAGRVASQRLAGPSGAAARPFASQGAAAGQAAAGQAAAGQGAATRQAQAAAVGQAAGRASRGVAKGVGGFLRPFGRVGGILWLEVTGVFFLLPVLVFGPRLWQTRSSWEHGPDHRAFVSSAILVVVFLYLGVTSFWRAHRRSAAH